MREALRTARQNCKFYPSIAELRELATSIGQARFEAERHQQTQHKLLAYQREAMASDLTAAERQTHLAELFAVLGDTMGMDAATPPTPRARPRVLHPAYCEPTKDPAARRQELRRQLAQVQRDDQDHTQGEDLCAANTEPLSPMTTTLHWPNQ